MPKDPILGQGRRKRFLNLRERCIDVLMARIDFIRDLGIVPRHMISPVLDICSPTQLRKIEYFNPSLIQDNDCLWKTYCIRSYNLKEDDFESIKTESGSNTKLTWRNLYFQKEREEQKRAEEIFAKTRSTIDKIQKNQKAHAIRFLNKPISYQNFVGHGRRNPGGGGGGLGGLFGVGQSSLISKARQEARAITDRITCKTNVRPPTSRYPTSKHSPQYQPQYGQYSPPHSGYDSSSSAYSPPSYSPPHNPAQMSPQRVPKTNLLANSSCEKSGEFSPVLAPSDPKLLSLSPIDSSKALDPLSKDKEKVQSPTKLRPQDKAKKINLCKTPSTPKSTTVCMTHDMSPDKNVKILRSKTTTCDSSKDISSAGLRSPITNTTKKRSANSSASAASSGLFLVKKRKSRPNMPAKPTIDTSLSSKR